MADLRTGPGSDSLRPHTHLNSECPSGRSSLLRTALQLCAGIIHVLNKRTVDDPSQKTRTKHEANHEACGCARGLFAGERPLTCGGDEEPGAALPPNFGAFFAAAGFTEQSAVAQSTVRALENVPEVRKRPDPQRPLHSARVWSPWQHHPIRAGPG